MLKKVGLKEPPSARITDIGIGKQQLVEIAKALSKKVRLLILDEPTASLNETDSDALLKLLMEFRKQGMTSIIISHKLNEIKKVADKITIIRDGGTVETLDCHSEDISEDRIIKGMVGRDMEDRYPPREPKIGETLLEVKNWNVFHQHHRDRKFLHDVNFNGPRRRGRRHCRADGGRPHRDGDEHLRSLLGAQDHRRGADARQAGRRQHHSARHRTRGLPMSPRTASSSVSC